MRKNLTFLVCIAISLLINFLLYNSFLNDFINDYYKNILIIIGINVILGTSLNLITGFTGQFSLGHAGFMAVGGYVSIAISTYLLRFSETLSAKPLSEIQSLWLLFSLSAVSALRLRDLWSAFPRCVCAVTISLSSLSASAKLSVS